MLELDPRSPVPLYRQLVDELRRRIAVGAYRPGDRLPTVRDLAVAARVNRNTAARAIQALEAEGLVSTRVGRGTFVEQAPPPLDRARAERRLAPLLDAAIVEAQTLGYPLEELGWTLSRRIDAFRARERDADAAAAGAGVSARAGTGAGTGAGAESDSDSDSGKGTEP